MSAAEIAFEAAEQIIQHAGKDAINLDFNVENTRELKELPDSIKSLVSLRSLDLSNTDVADISLLQDLPKLKKVRLDHTKVFDLRPLLPLNALREGEIQSISITGTPAANAHETLKLLNETPDSPTRTREILAYLRTLPAFPQPMLPQHYLEQFEQQARRIDYLEGQVKETHALFQNIRLEHQGLDQSIKASKITQEGITKAQEQVSTDFDQQTKSVSTQIEALKDDFKKQMQAAEAAFTEENAIKAPVQLWSDKQVEHEQNRKSAFFWFVFGMASVVAAAAAFLWFSIFAPDAMASLLAPIGCDSVIPETCKGISTKGIAATAAILTVFTVLLWFTRLQMKLYLAERHLVLDSRERRAFAETYVGLLKEGDTSKEAGEQRALVYSALFRPSSDGTVKEEGGLDPTLTAALSKLLTR